MGKKGIICPTSAAAGRRRWRQAAGGDPWGHPPPPNPSAHGVAFLAYGWQAVAWSGHALRPSSSYPGLIDNPIASSPAPNDDDDDNVVVVILRPRRQPLCL